MSYRDLLVHLDNGPACHHRLDVALGLARRFKAKLTGLYAVADSHVQGAGSHNRGSLLASMATDMETVLKERASEAGVEAQWEALIHTNDARVNLDMIRSARGFDLSILGQFDPATADGSVRADLLQQTMLRSGRPVLAIPHAGHFNSVGRRSVIAWNASRESVRAVNDALPLLKTAEAVIVLTLDPAGQPRKSVNGPLSDIVDHLEAHGIQAVTERLAFDRNAIGPAERLLSHLADEAADLLVMGAFGDIEDRTQNRTGLTTAILSNMTVPVLFSC